MPQWYGVRVSKCCLPRAGAVTSTRWWLRLRRFSASASCFLYYGPSADLQPHLLGSTNPSSARGNADSYAASCWLRGSSSARVPHLREYYRTCNDAPPLWSRSFFFIFFLSWSFQTSRMTSGHLWSDFPRTLRNVGSLVVCALVAFVGTAITAGGNGWCAHGYEQPGYEFGGAI